MQTAVLGSRARPGKYFTSAGRTALDPFSANVAKDSAAGPAVKDFGSKYCVSRTACGSIEPRRRDGVPNPRMVCAADTIEILNAQNYARTPSGTASIKATTGCGVKS